jgi:hypothetical protein
MNRTRPGPVILAALESGVLVALSATLFRRAPEIESFSQLARSTAQHHYRQSGVQGTGAGREAPPDSFKCADRNL